MKKLVIILYIFILQLNLVQALNPADGLNKLSENFSPECYKYYSKIDKKEIWDKNNKYQTYKINIDKTKNLIITQFGYILPYKFYNKNNNKVYNYSNNLGLENNVWQDYNKNTYHEINSKNQIILSFDEILEKDDFSFVFDYNSNRHIPIFFISNDNIYWDKIDKINIEDFSFKYLKIIFSATNGESIENIDIYELNFLKKSNIILVKSFYNDDIEIYSNFNCKEKNFDSEFKYYDLFSINSQSKSININLENNPKYNTYTKKDFDNDWVEDSIDNCKYRYNPKQNDQNGDGIGDICSDDDKDGIIGYYDNCINIYNPDQKDININGIGDLCEFDKDNDGVFDSIDNCINDKNPQQKDSDNDGIGDFCDNCKHYNPSQLDKNLNGIGDICEKIQKNLIENDDDEDSIINNKDNCRFVANINQVDTDKDGVGDLCDNCKKIQNKNQLDLNNNGIGDICEDSDNDGIEGLSDNCINTSNPKQKDNDNDGIGDLCEDDDNDKIIFINDNCPNDYNPKQKDTDGDSIGDKCDKKDNRYIESNKTFFIVLLIFIGVLFLFGIYYMTKKLK